MANIIPAAVLQKQFESVLGGHPDWQSRPVPEMVRTGVSEVDTATGGLPRGCLTEIIGQASSGRTCLLQSILAEATARDATQFHSTEPLADSYSNSRTLSPMSRQHPEPGHSIPPSRNCGGGCLYNENRLSAGCPSRWNRMLE